MIEQVNKALALSHCWYIYGHDLRSELKEHGIKYDQIIDHSAAFKKYVNEECVKIWVSDEESITMLKLMS